MRCPGCGATNPDDARWCGQCYRSLEREKPAVATSEGSGAATGEGEANPDAASQASEASRGPGPDASPEARPTGLSGGFRESAEGVEWECVSCGTFNSVELLACQVCGASLGAQFETPESAPRAEPRAALAASAVLPGSGHLLSGRPGSGIARAVLFVVWLVGGILLATSSGGAGPVWSALPLLLGAVALWAASLVDLTRAQRGESELLGGRGLLWLVVAVIVGSVIGLFGAAVSVNS
jgi:hypothetical protein